MRLVRVCHSDTGVSLIPPILARLLRNSVTNQFTIQLHSSRRNISVYVRRVDTHCETPPDKRCNRDPE